MRRVYMDTHTRKQVRRSVQWPVLRPATAGVAIGASPRRGWRGVDQYVKIESDATHPAPPSPFEPQPLPGPAEGIAAQSTDLSPTHHFLRRYGDEPARRDVPKSQTLWHSLRQGFHIKTRWGAPMRNRRHFRSFNSTEPHLQTALQIVDCRLCRPTYTVSTRVFHPDQFLYIFIFLFSFLVAKLLLLDFRGC